MILAFKPPPRADPVHILPVAPRLAKWRDRPEPALVLLWQRDAIGKVEPVIDRAVAVALDHFDIADQADMALEAGEVA